jgi:proteasome lid subunit RPN8/RPN11
LSVVDRLGSWKLADMVPGGGPDVVILAPLEEFPPEPVLSPNAAAKRRRGRRLELPELPEGFEPFTGHSQLLVRTALIRPESYRPGMVRPHIGNDRDAARLVRHMAYYDQEHVVTLAVDAKSELTAIHEAHIGTMSTAPAQARHVLKVGLMTGALGVVLVHNHPSGDPEPSVPDAVMTAAMEAAGMLLGLSVLDHVVVAAEGYASFQSERIYNWEGEGIRRFPSSVSATLEAQRERFKGAFAGMRSADE